MESARCKAFLAAAETGSLSKAAEVLNYTPSGVSQLVSAMEQDFGFSLLRRNRKGVTLTENGERILPAVRDFLLQENRIYQMAAEMNGLVIGSINIASYSSIATHWLPEVIRVFQEEYPQIKIKLREGIRQEVCRWITDKVADVAFLSYKDPMNYDWIPIAEDPMVAVLPKTHPLAGRKTYPLENCEQEQFIMPALGEDDDVKMMFQENNITPDIRFSTLGNYAALAMIEQGLGMSIMNDLVTKNWQCDVVKLPVEPTQNVSLGIAIPSLQNASPAVKRFVEFTAEYLKDRIPDASER